ncbi:MAG: hypothetical protein AAF849_03860 [Bacteroidota bacterium]
MPSKISKSNVALWGCVCSIINHKKSKDETNYFSSSFLIFFHFSCRQDTFCISGSGTENVELLQFQDLKQHFDLVIAQMIETYRPMHEDVLVVLYNALQMMSQKQGLQKLHNL